MFPAKENLRIKKKCFQKMFASSWFLKTSWGWQWVTVTASRGLFNRFAYPKLSFLADQGTDFHLRGLRSCGWNGSGTWTISSWDREAPGQGWGHFCWGREQQDLFLAHMSWHLVKRSQRQGSMWIVSQEAKSHVTLLTHITTPAYLMLVTAR